MALAHKRAGSWTSRPYRCSFTPRRLAAQKSQSAMEYLSTYGWAVLAIAIVLVAMYQLGLFGSSNVAPKAPAGGCEILRSSQGTSLEGECGELPEYVAQFNGQSSLITTPLTFPAGTYQQNFTVSAWIYINGNCAANNFYCGILDADNGNEGWGLMAGTGDVDFWVLASQGGTTQDMKFAAGKGAWADVAVTYDYVQGEYLANGYVDGSLVDGSVLRSPVSLPEPYSLEIGEARQSNQMVFNGLIANVQLYNTSLGASSIGALYTEGIGGAPVEPQYTVGWWPLNGNAQDYSGNSNEGTTYNVIYTGAWTPGYTAP